jgi:hypoxanthine phosphoribosyltransferase
MFEPVLRCELVTWSRVQELSRCLAYRILDSAFRPDIIVAVARGGYVPARILCDYLDVYALGSLRVVHYTGGARKQPTARIADPLNADIAGRCVLVVDDVTDTGETYRLAIEHLRSSGPALVRTATLQHKLTADYQPDYVARSIRAWRWVVYPWAVIEDVTGFLEGMRDPPLSEEAIARRLARDYGLSLPTKSLRDIATVMQRRHN